MKPEISVVIPIYKGEPTLANLLTELIPILSAITSKYEVILVDDDSPDQSWKIIEEFGKKNPRVRGIHLIRNFGQHNATLCGVRAARYPICVTMDDDLQHPPAEIGKLLSKFQEGFDVVYGTPLKQPQGFLRNLITSLTKKTLAFVMGIPNLKSISAFRLFKTELRDAFAQYQSPNVTLDVLLSWATTRFTSIPVGILPPPGHRSNYNYRSLIRYTLLVLTGYSTAPLRFASIIGFMMTLVGLGVFIYVIYIFIFAGSLPGFPFLASIIAIFGGTQLFALGIFGEYLARIFTRSMDKPTYVISKQTGSQKSFSK
jgi:glycosyltransferase involved in cell wall biosynthesis